MELPKLPLLPVLGESLTSGSSITDGLTSIGKLDQSISDTVSPWIGGTRKGGLIGGVSIGDIVSILVGLIFILAAVLSFKSTKDVVINGAKSLAV